MSETEREFLAPNPAARRKALLSAARRYRDSLTPEALEYLHGRGFDDAAITSFGFGYVADPRPEHTPARGMLAIPYLTPNGGVKAIRFRCIEDHDCKEAAHGKYWGEAGVKAGMFNTRDLMAQSDTIAVCEGELDAVTISGSGLLPAVAVPGATSWRPHFGRMLAGFSTVILVADGDVRKKKDKETASEKLVATFRQAMRSSGHVILCAAGDDANTVFVREGVEGLANLLKGEDE